MLYCAHKLSECYLNMLILQMAAERESSQNQSQQESEGDKEKKEEKN